MKTILFEKVLYEWSLSFVSEFNLTWSSLFHAAHCFGGGGGGGELPVGNLVSDQNSFRISPCYQKRVIGLCED